MKTVEVDMATYQFTSTFGKDLVVPADGQGAIQIDGTTLGTAKGIGTRGAWAFELGGGVYAGLAVYDDARSSTGKRLVITRGADSGNTITIDNFDLSKAQGSQGYLGIKLGSTQLAITASGEGNVWSDLNFNLALSALGDKFQAILGDRVVAANGAVITLAEGQTQVPVALVQEGEVTSDASLQLSASYTGASGSATSNAWGVNLQDSGPISQTLNGDYLVRTETYSGRTLFRYDSEGRETTVLSSGDTHYVHDAQGNQVAGTDAFISNNVIFGSSANDQINGLTGNDALSGGAGNDKIDGGTGDDLIGGGAGSDHILGGDGNDFISSAANLQSASLQLGPNDTLTGGGSADVVYGVDDNDSMWGDASGGARDAGYLDVVYHGADYMAGEDGDDTIEGGGKGDTLYGGAGKEQIDGSAGADIMLNGAAVATKFVASLAHLIGSRGQCDTQTEASNEVEWKDAA